MTENAPDTASDDVTVRLATIADLPFLSHGACSLAQQEAEDPNALPLAEDFASRIERYFANLISMPTALVLVAARGDKAIGFIAGTLQGMPNDFTTVNLYGLIQILWVEPEARRIHLGQTLVNLFEGTLRDQGVQHLDVQHAHSNLPAVLFWQHCGYAPISTTLRKKLDYNGKHD